MMKNFLAGIALVTALPVYAVPRVNNQHGPVGAASAYPFLVAKEKSSSGAPLSFIENVGQVTDQHHKARTDIQYKLSAANGLNIFVGDGAIHYQFSKCDNPTGDNDLRDNPNSEFPAPNSTVYSMYRMDVELVGANKHASVFADKKQEYYENYYTEATGEKGASAHAYNRIVYKDVYPHIDWILYTTGSGVKHEFAVHPGGKVSDIKLKYGGATDLRLDASGKLLASTPQGAIAENKPYSYAADGREIESNFHLQGDVLSYETGSYTGVLVIDPDLAWATYYGGAAEDVGNAAALDGGGRVYMTGHTLSVGNIATSGSFQATTGLGQDAFLVKFDSTGARQWATYYGGSADDAGLSVVVDGLSNVYVTGSTGSSAGISSTSAYQETFAAGGFDAFLVKFNSAGSRQWGTYYGGPGDDGGLSMSVVTDASNNVYIAGSTNSASNIASAGSFQTGHGGDRDAFVVKFNGSGGRLWATYWGGSGEDRGSSLAVDASGNVYLTGTTASAGMATAGAFKTTLGGSDAFLVKFNSSGSSRLWATYYGGSDGEEGRALAMDISGNIYIAGSTSSASGILGAGIHQTTYGGGIADGYIAKFSSSGAHMWDTYYGGSLEDEVRSITTDASANVYITGRALSTTGIATTGTYSSTHSGDFDAFLVKLNSSGTRQWGTYFGLGSTNEDGGLNVKVDASGTIYVAGKTNSSSGIATPGSHQSVYGTGSYDAFLARFCDTAVAGSITGTLTVCQAATTALSSTGNAGGVWSSSNTSAATVNSSSGLVTGVAAGTSTIAYTVTNACNTAVTTIVVTVMPLPDTGTITGTATVCEGATTTLANAAAGGVWSSTTTGVATVSAGVVTGVAQGTTTISYAVTNGCGTLAAIRVVTVNPLPNSGTITGIATVCPTTTTSLGNAATGGTWSSSTTSIGTIGSSTGVVTGVAEGTTTISYTVTNSCGTAVTVQVVTVNPAPNAGTITGTATVCPTGTTTLADATTGGVWSSTTTSVANVGTGGIVTGVAAGTTTISYTVTNSCGIAAATQVVTVNANPNAGTITGPGTVCPLATITLSDAATGGAWSSTTTTVATVGTGGAVTGVAAGTTTISYTVTNSCGTVAATRVVTVNPAPNAGTITGTFTVCPFSTSALTAVGSVGVGTWASSTTGVATVTATTGIVRGLTAGTTTISYTATNSCGTAVTTQVFTVNANPAAGFITGTATVCATATTTFSDASPGGVWSSVTTAVATVNTSGVVTGVSGGTSTISYTVTTACGTAAATRVVTVTAAPNAGTITGTPSICGTGTTTLSDAAPGGGWSSTAVGVATVSATGVVRGITPGTTTISYTVTNVCGTVAATVVVTVTAIPNAGTITGTATVCETATTTLADAATGGAWTSTATGVATVGTSGVVTGVTAGTSTISYTVTNSCGTVAATQVVTVNPAPNAGTITGTATVCPTFTTTLATTGTGGAWSSTATGVATVGTGGDVTAVAAGTTTISYTVTNSCGTVAATQVVTVNADPDAGSITGTAVTCPGATTTLGNVATGGVWSSTTTSVATVDASGVVTGVAAGTTTISYTSTTTCGTATTTQVVTVNLLPDAGSITGTAAVCPTFTTTLSDAAPGGVWSSTATGVATVGTAGDVTAVAAGTTTISYTVTNSCGTAAATHVVTVNALPDPGAITGTASVCPSFSITLSNAATGGAWSSTNTAVATIGTNGVVTAVSAGTTTISYTATTVCGTAAATVEVTVVPIPTSGAIFGSSAVCIAGTTTLNDPAAGGVWSSAAPGIASVDASGVVTGVTAGTVNVSYTVTNGCGVSAATRIVTVSAAPSAGTITGSFIVCEGASSTLTNAVTGGTWSSTDATVAAIDASGVVTGGVAGTAIISYVVTTGCGTAVATATVSVNPLPDAGSITGIASMCGTGTTTLSDPAPGGVWSSGTPGVASVDAAGVVTGMAVGTATITYSVTNSCGTAVATLDVSVNPLPDAGTITGVDSVCVMAATALVDAATGGVWSSSNPSVGTVGPTGLVTGLSAGTTTITYTVTNGCGTADATMDVTVNAAPMAATISGGPSVCKGSTITLSASLPGGEWTSSSPTIAAVGSATGIVTGVANGTAMISYTIINSCGTAFSTMAVSVLSAPSSVTITGTSTLAIGGSAVLSGTPGGGTWSSTNTSVVTVGSSTGVITGVTAGTSVVSYVVTNACGTGKAARTITVSRPDNGGTNTTAIGDPESYSLDIFPNPTNGALVITTTEEGLLTIVSADGKVVMHEAVNIRTLSVRLPGNLAAGVYIARFTGNSGKVTTARITYLPE